MPDINDLLKELEKQFPGACKRGSALEPKSYRSSGSISLDVALGGGWARSSVIDVIGKESSGKTLVTELAMIAAQKEEGLPSCIFDFENTFSRERFVSLGGDLDMLISVNGDGEKDMTIEMATEMLKIQLRHKCFACIVFDSTADMVSQLELDAAAAKGESIKSYPYTALGLSAQFRQIVGSGLLRRSGATIFYISQMRADVGGKGFKGMPPADKPGGGRALRFYSSNQIEVRRGEIWSGDIQRESGRVDEDIELGHETIIRVRKNKNNNKQGRVASFDLYTDGEIRGLDQIAELSQLAIATGAVRKEGSWMYLPDGSKVQGKDNLTEAIRANQDLAAQLKASVLNELELAQAAKALPAEELVPDDPDEALMDKMEIYGDE